MKILEENIEIVKKTVLEVDSSFIDLKPLAARVHLKIPAEISSRCTSIDLSNFIIKHCFEWGISLQNGDRLLMTEKVERKWSSGDIVVECIDDEIRLVSGYMLVDSVIEECGFANAYDTTTANIVILTKNHEGKLIRSDNSFWPETDLDADLDIHD